MPPQELQTPGTNQGQIDPTALTLSRAIRSAENTKYDQTVQEPDGSTSFGAYGWNRDNFQNWAKQYNLDPNDTSETNQDHLAYLKIKDMLDQGKSQSEIAALWNGAKVAGGKITPINPSYVDNVKNYYNQHSQGYATSQPQQTEQAQQNQSGYITSVPLQKTQDITTPLPEPGLGEQLQGRISDIGSALSGKTSSNIVSGAIQVGGAIGGAIGDTVNAVLNLIPGVKQLEGVVGQGITALAKTPVGQSIVSSIQDFSQKNPELAKDAEGVFNIITAIPILKGIGVAKDLAMDGLSQALKGVATDAFDNGMTNVAKTAGKSGVRFVADNPGIFKEAAAQGMIPDIENVAGRNVYRTAKIIDESWNKVGDLNSQVKDLLSDPKFTTATEDPSIIFKNTTKGFKDLNGIVHEGFPNAGLTSEDLIANAKRLNPENKLLWDKLANGQATMSDINKLRSDLDASVKSVYTTMNEPPFNKEMGAQLAGAMRDFVQANAPETQPLFKEMANQFNLQKAFSFIENKPVKSGLVKGTIQTGATVGGEALGNMTGVPVAGALGGRALGGFVGKRLTGGVEGILKRTLPGAVKTSTTQLLPGLVGLGAQKITKIKR